MSAIQATITPVEVVMQFVCIDLYFGAKLVVGEALHGREGLFDPFQPVGAGDHLAGGDLTGAGRYVIAVLALLILDQGGAQPGQIVKLEFSALAVDAHRGEFAGEMNGGVVLRFLQRAPGELAVLEGAEVLDLCGRREVEHFGPVDTANLPLRGRGKKQVPVLLFREVTGMAEHFAEEIDEEAREFLKVGRIAVDVLTVEEFV